MYVRDGITIWNGVVVECMVVTTRSPITKGLLRDHVERGGPGTVACLKFSFGNFQFVRSQLSMTCKNGWSVCVNVVEDIVLNGSI